MSRPSPTRRRDAEYQGGCGEWRRADVQAAIRVPTARQRGAAGSRARSETTAGQLEEPREAEEQLEEKLVALRVLDAKHSARPGKPPSAHVGTDAARAGVEAGKTSAALAKDAN